MLKSPLEVLKGEDSGRLLSETHQDVRDTTENNHISRVSSLCLISLGTVEANHWTLIHTFKDCLASRYYLTHQWGSSGGTTPPSDRFFKRRTEDTHFTLEKTMSTSVLVTFLPSMIPQSLHSLAQFFPFSSFPVALVSPWTANFWKDVWSCSMFKVLSLMVNKTCNKP